MRILLFFILMHTLLFSMYFPEDNRLLATLHQEEAVAKDSTKWLFVIGIEEYDTTDPVAYSVTSAKTFSETAQKLLGITKRNVYEILGTQATSGKIKTQLANLLSNVKERDTIYFYYSGHGIPVIPAKEPYLLPKDLSPALVGLEGDFKLENIYKRLSQSKASKVIAIIDSCFSGSTDGKSLFQGVAATRLIAKEAKFNEAKMVVMTAGRDEEFSNMYKKERQRLFSYFVVDALLHGMTDINTLFKHVSKHVQEVSFSMGDQFKQTPTLSGNTKLSF